MNKSSNIIGAILLSAAGFAYINSISIATAQENSPAQNSSSGNNNALDKTPVSVIPRTINTSNNIKNKLDSLKMRNFSCHLNNKPKSYPDVVFADNTPITELYRMHSPSVLAAGQSIWITDIFSSYQFNIKSQTPNSTTELMPSFSSKNMVLGMTDNELIQKKRIQNQSCVVHSPISTPVQETNIYCSNEYYKARYHNDAIYIIKNNICPKGKSAKTCDQSAIILNRYDMSGKDLWRTEIGKMPSASMIGEWENELLILNETGTMVAVNSNNGEVLWKKDYKSSISLEPDYYQFNDFYIDSKKGLLLIASRFHNEIATIDIATGDIIKSYNYGAPYPENKAVADDYHIIQLGDYAFSVSTIMGVDDGIIYERKGKNILTATEIRTGKQLWSYDIYQNPLSSNSPEKEEDIAIQVGDILITEDIVVVGFNKYATALDKTTGKVIWNDAFFPMNGHFGYQMWLSCFDSHLMIQSDKVYLYSSSTSK